MIFCFLVNPSSFQGTIILISVNWLVTMSIEVDSCPFCNLSKHRIVLERRLAVSILDAYPINPGHTLIIPKRHATSFFELDKNELYDLKILLESEEFGVQGFFGNGFFRQFVLSFGKCFSLELQV